MLRSSLTFLIILLTTSVFGQYAICGIAETDKDKKASVFVVLLNANDTVIADPTGKFCFHNLSAGEYFLFAFSEGRQSTVKRLQINNNEDNVKLLIASKMLKTVQVEGLSRIEEKKTHSIKTEIVDLSREVRSSVTVEELMNRSAGIRIRNTGGLGSDADIVIGGFDGKSVKILRDGIPLDYLGTSMGITKMPTSSADYIEIYKGVMPTEVGIDALGAAINIVSKKVDTTSGTAQYELGSFNTHRLNVNAFVRSNKKLSFGVNAFANYSANNFKVDNLPMMDPESGRTYFIQSRLFHNAYRQYSSEVFMNIENRKWADLFKITINSYVLSRQVQNDFVSRSRAFGGVLSNEQGYLIPSVQYKKRLFSDKLELSQFLVYSNISNQLIDSVKNAKYDWLGNRYKVVSASEMGIDMNNLEKPIIETNFQNLTYRGLFSYHIDNYQSLLLNVVNNYFIREADDLNNYHSKARLTYNRFIAGLGYQYHFWENRIEGLSQIKYLGSRAEGKLFNLVTGIIDEPVQNSGWSMAQSIKLKTYTGWLFRASVENTYRLPDQMEIFGDNLFTIPNITLQPEKSFNVNIGGQYKQDGKYKIELNSYYRNVRDLIRLKDLSQFQAIFLNLDNVRGYGVELEGWWKPIENLELSGNLTYNEFRYRGSNDNISKNEHFIDARISNLPFYFGNAMASYSFENLFDKRSSLRVYWVYSYVHQYYLDFIERQFEPDGFLGIYGKSKVFTNRVIPIQHLHTAGFVWSWERKENKLISFSAEINNMFNRPVYNAFKMQSAGRGIFGKFSYEF